MKVLIADEFGGFEFVLQSLSDGQVIYSLLGYLGQEGDQQINDIRILIEELDEAVVHEHFQNELLGLKVDVQEDLGQRKHQQQGTFGNALLGGDGLEGSFEVVEQVLLSDFPNDATRSLE